VQRERSEIFGRPVDIVPFRGLKPAVVDGILADRELLHAA
jgi:hypothetical protein